jgi:hypothetical protein
MKPIILLASIFLICNSPLAAHSQCAPNQVGCHNSQGADLKSVREIPVSTSPGELRLSFLPSPKVPLRLARNGVLLNPASDYTVQNRIINVSIEGQPTADDSYLVDYAIDAEAGEPTPASPPAAVSSRASQELLTEYLQRSLDQKLSPEASTPYPAQVPTAPTTQGVASPTKKPQELRSLRMLDNAIEDRNSIEEPVRPQSRDNRGVHRTAQGLEGIGDLSLTSPFDVLSTRPGGLGAAIESIDSNDSLSSRSSATKVHTSRSLRSLRMLQDRLSDSE